MRTRSNQSAAAVPAVLATEIDGLWADIQGEIRQAGRARPRALFLVGGEVVRADIDPADVATRDASQLTLESVRLQADAVGAEAVAVVLDTPFGADRAVVLTIQTVRSMVGRSAHYRKGPGGAIRFVGEYEEWKPLVSGGPDGRASRRHDSRVSA